MKILVTGASGFVGTHLCAHLVEAGHQVLAVVRRAGSAPVGSVEVLIDDIGPSTNWHGVFAGVDSVVHLAARVHVMRDESPDPLFEFRKVNTQGTVALAAEAAAQGVRRFVFLSSIKVNGERTTGTPYTASDPPDPQDDYGLSKFEAEVGLHAVHETAGIEVTVVRTPLVYGPNVGGNFLRILGLAGSRMPLPLAAVRNRRTMVAVWNLVDLLMQAATLPEAAGALVLAGDSASPSTADLVRAMRIASGKNAC